MFTPGRVATTIAGAFRAVFTCTNVRSTKGCFERGPLTDGTTSSRCVEVPEVVLNPLFTPHEFFVDGEASLGEHVFIEIGRHG